MAQRPGAGPSELQILALMARPRSNKAVADILHIQLRTVKHRIRSILAMLRFEALWISTGACMRSRFTSIPPASCR